MRFGGWLARVWCASMLCAAATLPASASAQACAPGRVVAPGTDGRCCWPAQTWSDADDWCLGVPNCPEGWGGDGPTCVRVATPEDASETALPSPPDAAATTLPDTPATVRVAIAPATLLADPHPPPDWEHASPPPPAIGPRRINLNVIGGGLALALSTYAGSLAEAFLWGYCGSVAFFVPGGALAGGALSAACGNAVGAATGIAFGLGQFVGVFLMVAGATIFRRRGVPLSVDLSHGDLSIAF